MTLLASTVDQVASDKADWQARPTTRAPRVVRIGFSSLSSPEIKLGPFQQPPKTYNRRSKKANEFLAKWMKSPEITLWKTAGWALKISREDSGPSSMSGGDVVDVYSSCGSIELVARIGTTVRPGLISARLDWAKLSRGGVNVNVLTSDRLTDMGAGATFYSTLVDVRRTRG